MSTNMALIMTVESTCAIEDKQLFRKQYTKFARKRSLARNKPSYSVGDQIFWLKPSILHPYPGRLLLLLSLPSFPSRRVIENVFGILRACWKIFSHPIKASVQNTERYVMAC